MFVYVVCHRFVDISKEADLSILQWICRVVIIGTEVMGISICQIHIREKVLTVVDPIPTNTME
jgi:hypothetical protein